MIKEFVRRLGVSAHLPGNYLHAGQTFYVGLQRREAAGVLMDDMLKRGLALGRLLVTDFSEPFASFTCPSARRDNNRLNSIEAAQRAVSETLDLISRKDLTAIASSNRYKHRLTVSGELDYLTLSFADDDADLTVKTIGPEGLSLAVAVCGRLGLCDGQEHYAYESGLPLDKVIKCARCSYHASSQRFVIELRADPGKILHVRLVGGGECHDLSNGSEDIRCIVSNEHARPIIFVNNQQLGETKGVRGTTEAMRTALRLSKVIE